MAIRQKESENDEKKKYTPDSLENSEYRKLFEEITKCAERPWNNEFNGNTGRKKAKIIKHPEFSDYLVLDFNHFYEFLLELVLKKGMSKESFQNKIGGSGIEWNSFYRGKIRFVSSFIIKIGVCATAEFTKTPLINLLAQFLHDCEQEHKKIRLFSYVEYEEIIQSLFQEMRHSVKQPLEKSSSSFLQDAPEVFAKQAFSDNRHEIIYVSGKDKRLNPYNLNELPLVGRKAEIDLLDEFIEADGKFKIWAIAGPSGAGKTRLAIELASKLNNWTKWVLHKDDRTELDYWNRWSPDNPTLIIIDYMYGFEEVIRTLMKNRFKNNIPNIRLLVIDHVFSKDLPRDKRWGLTDEGRSHDQNEDFFFKKEPLDLTRKHNRDSETETLDSKQTPHPDQEKIIKGMIAHLAEINVENNQVSEAHDFLWKMQGGYYPLFAALVGDAIKLRKNYKELNRRQLIDYHLSGSDRLPWEYRVSGTGELSIPGRWASYFIAAATARREISYRDLTNAAANCINSEENRSNIFDEAKEICQRIVTDNNTKILKPFEPDILGESFFLKLLLSLENSPACQKEFLQIFMSGNAEKHAKDAIQFIAFIQRLTRNLLNDNQKDVETFWEVLFDFLKPSDFVSSEFLRWAVNAALIDVIGAIQEQFPEKVSNLLNKIESGSLNNVKIDELLEEALIYSMRYFELIHQPKKIAPKIPEEMAELFCRYTAMDSERGRKTPLIIASYLKFNKVINAILINSNVNIETSIIGGQNALMAACLEGYADTARILLERGAKIEATDNEGRTALMHASANGHTDIIRLLLDESADIEAADNEGRTALILTSANGDTDTVRFLLGEGADVQTTDNLGLAALNYAIRYGHTDTARLLLDGGADIEAAHNQGGTALMLASGTGHTDTVRLLLDEDADIEATDNRGRTALMLASGNGHTDTVRLLLDGGADTEAADNQGRTALMYANGNGQTDTVRLLLDRGVDIEAADNEGLTALMIASTNGHIDTVRLLLDGGADVNAADNEGRTALMLASTNGYNDTVRLLLDGGADIETTNNIGGTALIYASGNGHTDTITLLLDRGADIEAADNEGRTALMLASTNCHTETVRLLLDGGADIDAADNEGRTALMLASTNGHTETVRLLLDGGADIETTNNTGGTALIYASVNGHIDTITLLLDGGADIEATSHEGFTALMYASVYGDTDTIRLLLEGGANIDASDKEKHTAVWWAYQNDHIEVVKFLLQREARLDVSEAIGMLFYKLLNLIKIKK